MAELTAGNFYWTGYKPAGKNPLYRYTRGNKSFGTALSHQGGAGGCTGYSWNEAGNWVELTLMVDRGKRVLDLVFRVKSMVMHSRSL